MNTQFNRGPPPPPPGQRPPPPPPPAPYGGGPPGQQQQMMGGGGYNGYQQGGYGGGGGAPCAFPSLYSLSPSPLLLVGMRPPLTFSLVLSRAQTAAAGTSSVDRRRATAAEEVEEDRLLDTAAATSRAPSLPSTLYYPVRLRLLTPKLTRPPSYLCTPPSSSSLTPMHSALLSLSRARLVVPRGLSRAQLFALSASASQGQEARARDAAGAPVVASAWGSSARPPRARERRAIWCARAQSEAESLLRDALAAVRRLPGSAAARRGDSRSVRAEAQLEKVVSARQRSP